MAKPIDTSPGGPTYTLPELAEISAIDYRTLHNWQKRGMLHASRQVANGSGTVSIYDEGDALQILILAELRRSGVEVRVLEAIAERVWEISRERIDEGIRLVVSDGHVTLSSESDLSERLSEDRPSHVLPIRRVLHALTSLPHAA
jgi:DNA-binding transcriptional MerR regulator